MTKSCHAIIAYVATLVLAVSFSAMAQSQLEMGQLATAESYVFSGRCDRAIVILRPLYERYPGNIRILSTLRNAYQCDRQTDSALALIEREVAMSVSPRQKVQLLLESAGIHLREGRKEKAEPLIVEALSHSQAEPRIYEQVADTYMQGGYYSDAINFLKDSRTQLGDSGLFHERLAQLYEILRNYGDAAREYFAMQVADTSRELFALGKINGLVKLDAEEDFDTGLPKALAEMVQKHPHSALANKVYAFYLVSQGKLDDAFARYLLLDSLDRNSGRNLLEFARLARNEGLHTLVEKACTELERRRESPYLTQARLFLAESHRQEGRYTKAAETYRQIAEKAPDRRIIAEALYALAEIQLRGLHNPEAAIDVLQTLRSDYPLELSAGRALVLMADCELARGKPEEAARLYDSVNLSHLPVRDQEELLYKKAELPFLLGEFAEARDAYGRMMNSFPKSVYVNDALRRILLISEYSGMEETTLRMFSGALYARERFEFDSSLAVLEKLKHRGSSLLPEIAWLEAAQIYATLGNFSQALLQLDSLVYYFPESFSAPLALEMMGGHLCAR